MDTLDRSNVADREDYEVAPDLTPATRWHFSPDDDHAPDLYFPTEAEACAAQQGWRIALGFHPITGDRERTGRLDVVRSQMLAALKRAESFVAGFEGDETQGDIDGPAGLLAALRASIASAEGDATPADPVKADMLAALKQIRDGAAPDGRWLDSDGSAIDGHDSEEDEPDEDEWPGATWEPYTEEEQAGFLASVVAIADKAIARAEGRA